MWLQARVIAHDGNGTSSAFGMHSDQRNMRLMFLNGESMDARARKALTYYLFREMKTHDGYGSSGKATCEYRDY